LRSPLDCAIVLHGARSNDGGVLVRRGDLRGERLTSLKMLRISRRRQLSLSTDGSGGTAEGCPSAGRRPHGSTSRIVRRTPAPKKTALARHFQDRRGPMRGNTSSLAWFSIVFAIGP